MSDSANGSVLEVEEVDLSFGGLQALRGVSFDVQPGETLGIVGPNGAGKTAMLNCVSGVYYPQRGRIRFQGSDITRMKPERIASLGIARTFQSTEHFHEFSVENFVLLGRTWQVRQSILAAATWWPGAARAEATERAAVDDLLEEYGLLGFATHHLSELPYGVQKMVDIIRAIAARPSIILMDEPTSGTGQADRHALVGLLDSVRKRDVPMVVVDHDLNFVSRVCDRIVVMNFGSVIGIGQPRDLFARADVIEAYVGTPADQRQERISS